MFEAIFASVVGAAASSILGGVVVNLKPYLLNLIVVRPNSGTG
jgi:hypothetical protein